MFVAVSVLVSACVPGCTAFGPDRGAGSFVVSGIPTSAPPKTTLRIDFSGSHVSMLDKDGYGVGANYINYALYPSDKRQGEPVAGGTLVTDNCGCFRARVRPLKGAIVELTLPETPGTYIFYARIRSGEEDPAYGTMYTYIDKEWTIEVATPAPAAAANPVARFFPDQAPADKDVPAFVDGRLSSDPLGQALTYAWDLDGDGTYGDPTDGGTGQTPPAGTAYVSTAAMNQTWLRRTQYQPVGLKVTAADGRSATTTGTMRITTGIGGGSYLYTPAPHVHAPNTPIVPEIVLAPGIAAGIGTGNALTICLDADGDDVFGDGGPVVVATAPSPLEAPILLPATVANPATGFHRISATLWRNDFNQDCAITSGDTFENRETRPLAQVVSTVYETSAAAARKGAKQYRARATLRTTGAVPVAVGSVNAKGNAQGVIVRGTYSFRPPARGNGVKRPAALAAFRGGPYVLRVGEASMGLVRQAGAFPIVGTSTMLLRGSGGGLACLAVVGRDTSSAYTLLGGTGPAARVSMTVTAPAVPYPNGRAKPPADINPKKVKQSGATRGSGTVVASTAKRARPLPAACRPLVRHLPTR